MEEELGSAADLDDWLQILEKRILNRAPQNHDNYSAIAVRLGANELA